MNLFEAKRILKANNFKLIKEAAGEVKIVIDFDIERTATSRANPNNSSERRDYHIMKSQIKKMERERELTSDELRQTPDHDKLGGAKMNNQRVKTNYTTSYIWINPESVQAEADEFGVRTKLEYSQVSTECDEGDLNPYYEYGVDHLFPERCGESCPYCAIKYFRTYRATLIGKADAMMEYLGVETLDEDEVQPMVTDLVDTWTKAYTVPCRRTGCDVHPGITDNSVKVTIVDSTDDDDIEAEEEIVQRIV